MAQLKYIRFDTDFFDKPKIKGFVHRQGQLSVSFLIRLLCAMGRATEGKISRDCWEAIGAEAGLDVVKTEELVGYCLDNGILRGSKDALTNPRVLEDQDALEKKRKLTKDRVTEYRKRQRTDEEKPPPAPTLAPILASAVPFQPYVPAESVRNLVKADKEQIDDDDPNMKIALEKLETPEGQDWTFDNRYIGAGRRPMRDYPTIWLTPQELARVIAKLEGSNIPQESYKDLFFKVESVLKTNLSQGKSNQYVTAYAWLIGRFFEELLEVSTKEARLAKALETPTRYEQRR